MQLLQKVEIAKNYQMPTCLAPKSSPVTPNILADTIRCQFSIKEELLRRLVRQFRAGLVFEAHRPLCHSTLGSGVMKKMKQYLTLGLRVIKKKKKLF